MNKFNVYEIAQKDAPICQQAHVTGNLAYIRYAFAKSLSKGPSGISDPLWKDISPNGDFFYSDYPIPEGLGTRFKIAADKEAIYFLVECPEPKMHDLREKTDHYDPRQTRPRMFMKPPTSPMPPVWQDDCVEIFISPENDHHGYYRFCLAGSNSREATYHKVFVWGWRTDVQPNSEKLDICWESDIAKYKNKWSAYFKIPFVSMKLNPEALNTSWGLNVIRNRNPKPYMDSRWNQTFSGTHFPLNFGTLYLQKPKIYVNRVLFGKENNREIKLSRNELTMVVENLDKKSFKGRMKIVVMEGRRPNERKFHASTKIFSVPPEKQKNIITWFRLPYMEWLHNRIYITIENSQGKRMYDASYGFGSEGLRAFLDFSRDMAPANPKPGDKDFYYKKIRYIIGKLPKITRKNTNDGAPSDFYLEAHDKSVGFNLMEAGCLQKIADYLYTLFDNDNDRLSAVVHFVNQPDVINSSFANSRLSSRISPLSMLRLGGGICECYSKLVLGICEKMICDETGKTYCGWMIGFPGHVMTVVQKGSREVLLDGEVGKFYYMKDNRTLAGPEDLCRDHELVKRSGNGLTNFFPGMEQHHCYLPACRAAWPNGAPIE